MKNIKIVKKKTVEVDLDNILDIDKVNEIYYDSNRKLFSIKFKNNIEITLNGKTKNIHCLSKLDFNKLTKKEYNKVLNFINEFNTYINNELKE